MIEKLLWEDCMFKALLILVCKSALRIHHTPEKTCILLLMLSKHLSSRLLTKIIKKHQEMYLHLTLTQCIYKILHRDTDGSHNTFGYILLHFKIKALLVEKFGIEGREKKVFSSPFTAWKYSPMSQMEKWLKRY